MGGQGLEWLGQSGRGWWVGGAEWVEHAEWARLETHLDSNSSLYKCTLGHLALWPYLKGLEED